jgi:hypothetical protein
LAQKTVGGFIEFIFGGARRLSIVSAAEPFSLPACAVSRSVRSGGGFLKMANKFYDITFTPGVKAAQEHYGSRRRYEKIEQNAAAQNAVLSDAEADFIEQRDGFYMASVSEDGQPYIQFRGGPRGFLRVLDEKTLAYADFRGNLQYISVGNLRTKPKSKTCRKRRRFLKNWLIRITKRKSNAP